MKKNIILITTAIFLFCSCNIDYAPSTISTSIADSKEKGFLVAEYRMDSVVVLDKKKPFVVKSLWVEKTHASAMNSFGIESFKADSNSFQIVLDMGINSYFTSDNFTTNWIIIGEKEQSAISEGRMVSVFLSDKEALKNTRFKVYYIKRPFVSTYDTVKIAEFKLKKL